MKTSAAWMTIGVLCGVAAVAASAYGVEPLPQTELRIERAALFKNGLGYFVASGTLPENATAVRIGQLPVPAYGTFWVGYPESVKVRSLVTSLEEVEERYPIQSVGQLLQANKGCRVTLRTGPGERDVVEGVVRETVASGAPPEPASPYVMDVRRGPDPFGGRGYYPQGGMVVLVETADGLVAVNAGSIIRADLPVKDVADSVTTTLKRPGLRMELEQPAPGAPLSVSYLARGITWSPSYRIDLSDPEQALFTAHAVIVNEVADLEGVALDLVTGFPNIRFGDVLSPVAMSQPLADFLNSLATGRTEGQREGVMAQQALFANVARYSGMPGGMGGGGYGGTGAPAGAPLPTYATAAEGTVSEDLFLYPVKDFSLRRGETAYVPLFTAKMPYHSIYTWRIGDYLGAGDRYQQEKPQPDAMPTEEVWHACRLRNTLDMPLTTAAAEFVTGAQFTGQDICYYTAPGAETTVRINRAMNVLAEQAEYETERQRNAAQFYGSSFDLVTVRGELKVRSRLDKAATVEITKELSGEILEKTGDAKDVATAKGLQKVNPRHTLTWSIDVKPGEEQTLAYVYQVYIRE